MGSVGAGIASVGGSLAQAQEMKRADAIARIKQAIEQGRLGVEQERADTERQYADTNTRRLTMDQQREASLQKLRDAQIAEIMKRVNQSPPMVQKLKDAETALGRPLKDDEKLATLGIKPAHVPQSEYDKTIERLRGEAEMFQKYPWLGKLLHPPREGAASVGPRSVEDRAKDVEAGLAKLTDFKQGKERDEVATYMREHKMSASGKLKPEMEAGLRVLHVALWGSASTAGLDKTIGVLDSSGSRAKLIAAGVGRTPDPKEWTITKLAHAGFYSAMSKEEKDYVYQLNRAISAINALRTITGLPRSTQALMDRYVLELPNPVTTPSSADARNQLQLIEREIGAAMAKATGGGGGEVPNAAPSGDMLPGEQIEQRP